MTATGNSLYMNESWQREGGLSAERGSLQPRGLEQNYNSVTQGVGKGKAGLNPSRAKPLGKAGFQPLNQNTQSKTDGVSGGRQNSTAGKGDRK